MSRNKLTAEELLQLDKTKELLDNYSDNEGIKHKIKYDLAKTNNYEKGVYYHATGGFGEVGLSDGLYLGKDRKALDNFYNCDGTFGGIEVYKGNPKFLDLTIHEEFEQFEILAIEKFSQLKHKEHIKLLTIDLGYDGIRYYDPVATGEEFVLYNYEKIKLMKLKINKWKEKML